ncbi:DUF4347 domain-containing protein [Scytonema hofmannii FACHB-248]|uniref:DUF4347 domain-containing protein n=1 Tax=Scytonema hofmannii FACHB-248 TaxID=1842502 RepID=A0ABR8GTG5_9CYAN|nr:MULTISPECIES: DUF4347 domain-containing protein [Nostocales]MBD2606784.1 DUF4347 domain-containing protein [Scytonema hofmannii FACHB-248]
MTLQSNDSLVKEIIFIDPTVEDYESLIAGIYPDTKVVILDQMKDGISQITENLQGGTYKAVHIVSHGSEGSLQLGSKQLNSSNLDSYKSQLQQWAKYLTDEADILLYGCDVAAGETGVGFVQQLSQLMGADVAASNDLTGSAALGGDWDLEVKTGKIEAPLAFQVGVMEAYNAVLASAGDVIINEFSQGSDNAKEWVEILVVKDNLDLRNHRLVDTNATNPQNPDGLDITLSGSGFSSLRAGTLIVLYNGGDRDSTITPDLTYNPAGGDYVLQISSQNMSGDFAVIRNINGGWNNTAGAFGNASTDAPRLLNVSGTEIYKFPIAASGSRSKTPDSGKFTTYLGNTIAGATTASNWSDDAASTIATPGLANGGNNTGWINILRGVVKVVNTPAVTINNPSPASNELFGFSLASSSGSILIGAPKADGEKGEAYRFGINGLFQQTFTNPSSVTAEQFGFAVATDGTNYLVGASKWDALDVGIAYRFDANAANQQTFNNSVNNDDSEFGSAIAILSNGNYVISAPEKGKSSPTDNAGQVRLFSSNGTLIKDITNPNDPQNPIIQDARFGFSVAAADNNIFIGSPGFTSGMNFAAGFGTGKAYLYNTTSNNFQSFTNPNASSQDFFGFSVASNSNGTRFLVGAPGEIIGGTAGIAYLFDNNSTLLRTFTNSDTTNQGFGASVAFVGNDILIGSPGGFTLNLTTGFNPTPNRGAVYLYDGDGTTPTYNLDRIFTNPSTGDDGFGAAISVINNNRIAISAPYYDAGSINDAGIAYIFNINNTLPTASNKTVTTNEDTTYTLNATDFNFGDADSDNLQKVQVTSLLGAGSLTLNGTAVNANQEISIADITAGKFKFTPVADANGSNYASFQFKVSDGVDFSTSAYAMTIDVNSVNDRPTFNIGANQSVKTGAAQQAIAGWASGFYSGAANESGQGINNYIVDFVNSSDSQFFDVAPKINPSTINPLTGDLIYKPASTITSSKTVEFKVKVQDNGGDNDLSVEQTFKITVNPTTTNLLNGTPSADNLIGTDQSDRISGLDNDDIIYGGLGSDRIFGDNGNDILYGDLGIISNIDPKLISDVQPAYGATFSMDDTIAGGAGNDKIYGNLGNDKLYGDEGNDQIWGGEGDDQIWGSYGNDTLYGGTGKDAFVLVRGQGADTIMDFTTEDVLGCAGALKYSSLSPQVVNGDTLITDTGTNQLLATLKGFTGTVNYGGLF